MKRFLSFVLVFSLLAIPFAAAAQVVDNADTYVLYYTYTDTAKAGLSISSGTATCTAKAISISSSNAVSITMTLQRKVGTKWTDVSSWSASGKGSASLTKTKAVSSGYQYRTQVSGSIKNSSGTSLETFSATSNPFTY